MSICYISKNLLTITWPKLTGQNVENEFMKRKLLVRLVIPELFDGKHNFINVLKIISQSQKLAAINLYVYL